VSTILAQVAARLPIAAMPANASARQMPIPRALEFSFIQVSR
jgi:hypothetical protein